MDCQFFLVAFCCAIFSNAGALQTRSSSSGAGKADQTCGLDNTNFYCPVDAICKPRSQRCTGEEICIDPQTRMEPECYETSTPGKYIIRQGHANLGLSGSKKLLEHWFVTFRGLTYEFGKSYDVQILDVLDPIYKYINGRELNSGGIETVGSSYCTWEDATRFANRWDTDYSLFFNNCQHFARAMIEYLKESPCNQPSSSRSKQVESLDNYITTLLANCSVVCCDTESSAYPTAAASAWVIAFGVSAYSVINLLVWLWGTTLFPCCSS